jgi:hypothetical protein
VKAKNLLIQVTKAGKIAGLLVPLGKVKMVIKTGDLLVSQLKSTNLRELVRELEGLNPDFSADPYVKHYDNNRRNKQSTDYLTILPVSDAARVVKTLVPLYGPPMSYIVSNYFGDVRYGSGWRSNARIAEWAPKKFASVLEICDLLSQLFPKPSVNGGPFYVSRMNVIKVYMPKDCFPLNLLKSDDPDEWTRLNKISWQKSIDRKKLKQIGKALDGV